MLNVYLYSVSVVSLSAFYLAALVLVNNALKLAFGVEVDLETRQFVAGSAGVILATLPMWSIHWRWLRRQFNQAAVNEVFFHRFYLFTVICLSAMAILISGSLTVSHLLGLLLHLHTTSAAGLQKTLTALSVLGVSISIWVHHWRQFKGNLGQFLPAPASTDPA